MPVIKLKNEPRRYMGPRWARVPARFGRGHLLDLLKYLAEREVREAAERLVNDARIAQGVRSLLEFVR